MSKDAHPDDLTPGERTGLLDAIDDLGSHKPPKGFGGEDDDDDEPEDDDAEGADADDEAEPEDEDDEPDDDEPDAEEDDPEDEPDDDEEDAPEGDDAAEGDETAAAAEPIKRKDGAEWNGTAKRWQKEGKFVEGDPPPAPAAKDSKDAKGATTQDTGWAPFSVTVDREAVPIADVAVSKANGHVIYAVPEAKAADFNRRIVRGIAAERYWRQLTDEKRTIEEERKALAERPPVRTDSEVEADVLLEALKPHLATLFDETELENLNLKVKVAQGEEKGKLSEWETSRVTAREAEGKEREAVANELGDMVAGIIADDTGALRPEYKHLDDAAMTELMPLVMKHANALVTKNPEGKYARQHELAEFVVAQFAAARKPAVAEPPKADPTPAKGTTGKDTGKAGDRAERFNTGVTTAARPTSTNLKERRTREKGRPATRRTTGESRGRKDRDRRTPEQREEDEFLKLKRSYTTSATLDMGGHDDD